MKILVLTNFAESQVYGVYEAVISQADCLGQRNNPTDLAVREDYRQTQPLPKRFGAKMLPIIPTPPPLVDYQTEDDLSQEHREYVDRLADTLSNIVNDYDAVMTHDWVFTGWNLPFFLALEKLADTTRSVKWLHWVHSIPGVHRPWWYLRRLGEINHRVVYPTKSDRLRVANFFRTEPSNVLSIPHVVDLRQMFSFSDETLDFIDSHPEIIDSQFVQIYPASSDRFEPKGVRELVLLFGCLKSWGYDSLLIVANHNAGSLNAKEDISYLKALGASVGLTDRDLVFTSDFDPWTSGVPKHSLCELLMFANLFVYPSQHESFGLILPEACLASGSLPVINLSLDVQTEVAGFNGLMTHFGSLYATWEVTDEKAWLSSIAGQIIAQFRAEESLKTRNHMMRTYNRDIVYERYYVPVLVQNWGM